MRQVNFASNLFLWKAQINEIELLRNCKFYIDNNGKFFIFAKLSAPKRARISNLRNKVPTKLTCFTVVKGENIRCNSLDYRYSSI